MTGVPTFFYFPIFFYVFFKKTQKNVGTLSFLPCFFEILCSKKRKFQHFSMSQTFSMFQKYIEKVWDIENFCNIAKFWTIKAKMTKSQHFSMITFLDGHASWLKCGQISMIQALCVLQTYFHFLFQPKIKYFPKNF